MGIFDNDPLPVPEDRLVVTLDEARALGPLMTYDVAMLEDGVLWTLKHGLALGVRWWLKHQAMSPNDLAYEWFVTTAPPVSITEEEA